MEGLIIYGLFFVICVFIPILIKHRLFIPITMLSYFIVGLVSDKQFFNDNPRRFFWIVNNLPEYKKRALHEQGLSSYIALKKAIAQADYIQVWDIMQDIDGEYNE